MRTSRLAEALWPTGRCRVLGLLFGHPDDEFHLRDIARLTGLAPATVQREVTSLHAAGVLTRRVSGRQVYYGAQQSCPIFTELRGIALKTTGLADAVCDTLEPFADRIEVAFIFGSVARGDMTNESDVDLLVIGEVGLRDLTPVLQALERELRRDINVVTMSAQEFAERASAGEHFVSTVLSAPMIFVSGDAYELGRLAGSATTSSARSDAG